MSEIKAGQLRRQTFGRPFLIVRRGEELGRAPGLMNPHRPGVWAWECSWAPGYSQWVWESLLLKDSELLAEVE